MSFVAYKSLTLSYMLTPWLLKSNNYQIRTLWSISYFTLSFTCSTFILIVVKFLPKTIKGRSSSRRSLLLCYQCEFRNRWFPDRKRRERTDIDPDKKQS